MPANLTPEFERAEQQYREARTDEERLQALRLMLATIPKHKGTEKLQAEIKRKISLVRKAMQQRSGPVHGPDPFQIPKKGIPQVLLLGPPNTGKSSILRVACGVDVKVADYPYTTQVPQPGIWIWNRSRIELIDAPPVEKGRVPPGLMGTIRAADLLCLVVDLAGDPFGQIEMLLELLHERGIEIRSEPRDVWVHEPAKQKPAVVVLNRIDLEDAGAVQVVRELMGNRWRYCGVSTIIPLGFDDLFQALWELAAMIRVYSKQPGKEPVLDEPFLLPRGSTIEDLARAIHRDLPELMTYARVWGDGRLPGQMVKRDALLQDGDIVEIHER